MNKNNILKLLTCFPLKSNVYESLSLICASKHPEHDSEAVEETGFFLGKTWDIITPKCWNEHFWVLTFFTDTAFRYYMPSIIKCYMEDPVVVDLAIMSVLYGTADMYDLIQNESKRVNLATDFYFNQWKGFNAKQLNCVNLFFHYIKETDDLPYMKELATKAIDVTSYLKNKKDELYKK